MTEGRPVLPDPRGTWRVTSVWSSPLESWGDRGTEEEGTAQGRPADTPGV